MAPRTRSSKLDGTGAHPSTRLVVGLAEDVREKGPSIARFLDLGCGSGILAVAAAHLWPEASGLAIDNDPEATACSEENFARNRVQRVAIQTGTLVEADGAILSGILLEQVDDVLATYAQTGLTLVRRQDEGEWAGLLLRKSSSTG